MASSWGSSWGTSWGNSWGSVSTPVEVQATGSGGEDPDKFTFRGQKRLNLDDDAIILAVIQAFMKKMN